VLHHRTMSNDTPIAVLDTNVMLDVYSCHDLANEYRKGGDVAGPEATYRRARARESLMLAIYLHSIRATTYGLHHEVPRMLTEMVDPAAHGAWENHFTTLFVHFVKDEVLFGWRDEFVPDNDLGVEGEAADERLLTYARDNKISLITNEGFKVRGVKDKKLRARAKAQGVEVFTPREFYEGKLDEVPAMQAFLKRFAERAPAYIKQHNREFGPSKVGDSLKLLLGVYRHILFGEIRDGSLLPVSAAK
jgi:hypothetical protein